MRIMFGVGIEMMIDEMVVRVSPRTLPHSGEVQCASHGN